MFFFHVFIHVCVCVCFCISISICAMSKNGNRIHWLLFVSVVHFGVLVEGGCRNFHSHCYHVLHFITFHSLWHCLAHKKYPVFGRCVTLSFAFGHSNSTLFHVLLCIIACIECALFAAAHFVYTDYVISFLNNISDNEVARLQAEPVFHVQYNFQ